MKRFELLVVFALTALPAPGADIELKMSAVSADVSPDPFDPAWQKAPAAELPLMPQTIIPPGGGGAVENVRVQALESRQNVYFRLEWADQTVDDDPSKAEGFSDAVALEFPMQPEAMPAPFMGDKDNAVAIWRWSASAQKDFDRGFQSNTTGRPRLVWDVYPFAGDPTFRAGEKAGNIISQRKRTSPVESLAAKGFGTLTPTDDQPVQGQGVWKDGRWHVVFRRSMSGTPPFAGGSRLYIAAAVWDGGARERDGIKSVSVWQTLAMPGAAEAPPVANSVAKGKRVFFRYGCAVCHGKDGAGGVPNPNAQTNPIPALTRVKEGFTKDELLKVIFNGREPERADPAGPPARFKMNAWGSVMEKDEADALVEYLNSLMAKATGQEW